MLDWKERQHLAGKRRSKCCNAPLINAQFERRACSNASKMLAFLYFA